MGKAKLQHTNRAFKLLCKLVEVPPTKRAAQKLRNGKGQLVPVWEWLKQELPPKEFLPKGTCFTTFSKDKEECKKCTLAEDCFKATYKELFR